MTTKHKPLSEQVVVITGASSGIGLETAELAASRGAKVVLAARSARTIEEIAATITHAGGTALAVECDVARREDVARVANLAIAQFSRIDTWVNNAGISINGRLDEVSEDDARRLFDTNFWGVYNGSLAALPLLRRTNGALINVGSELSEAAIPYQGIYTASKHAVKGFTDALRIEVEELDHSDVSVTLIQPTAVNTPFARHAKNYRDREAQLPPPKIDPREVAEAILDVAVRPARSRRVGSLSTINTTLAFLAPSVADRMAARRAEDQFRDAPNRDHDGALHRPSEQSTTAGHSHGQRDGI
ncbi:MAG: SDR family NAD(P)-dependent oxidoreductase [Phycisphaerae bacterium]|nr:SDR family NAD(P)-dependent oxidoreductase [Phycisphaerae bacterium]